MNKEIFFKENNLLLDAYINAPSKIDWTPTPNTMFGPSISIQ